VSVPEPIAVPRGAAAAAFEDALVVADESASRYGYADSPLTPLADRVTDLVVAALRDRPLPDVGIPVEPLNDGQVLIDLRGAIDTVPEDLEVVGFGMEMDMVMGIGPSGARLAIVLYLGPTGVRVAYVAVSTGRRGGSLPRELAEIDAVASHVLSAMRSGAMEQILIGEAERHVIGDERVWNELARERPDDETLARAVELSRTTDDPLAYRLDDVGVLLRDGVGRWYTAELDFDHQAPGVVVLENGPLVSLRRLVGE
jgi:hypothetical protein